MGTSLFSRYKQRQNANFLLWNRQRVLHILALLALIAMVCLTFNPAQAVTATHTQGKVDSGCQNFTYTSDGNPFVLCPGPFPTGGNCVWWGWEQWHLLGYDLPDNWGNAADWIVDAERFGLPIGTTPRIGSLAVFPVADGVWAFGTAGHVAFVTAVSPDNQTFNVTYQNYGDTTPMYIGQGYNVSYINQPRFQNGQMRFIYFPKTIDPKLFDQLPGVNGNNLSTIQQANDDLNSAGTDGTLAGSRVALGLTAGSYDQEFSADFVGNGYTNFLLYNRQAGRLDVLALNYPYQRYLPDVTRNHPPNATQETEQSYRVSLHDGKTSATGWGQNLNIYVGDFTGSGHAEILLYDRVSGEMQLLTLTPQLTIDKHVIFNGWGAGWEIYPGRFDSQSTDLLLYKRYAVPATIPTITPPGTTSGVTPTPGTTPTATPTAGITPTATPTAGTTPTGGATPTPTSAPTATTQSSPTPTPTPTGSAPATTQQTGYTQQGGQASGQQSGSGEPLDNSGNSPSDWNASGLTAELFLVSFAKDFTVRTTQDSLLWHNSWEIYVGRFVNTNRDGLFLYDRNVGEGRMVDFSSQLALAQFQFLHNLGGDWQVHTGDFQGQGRAQLLLYDQSTGEARISTFKSDLSIEQTYSYEDWGSGMVLYVGHFGLPSLSIMLYDPQQAQSTFLAFDTAFNVSHLFTAKSWGPTSQILLGSFLDRSQCLDQNNCTNGDDILVLDRTTGMVQQYVFSFGEQFGEYDNRSQAFLREGLAAAEIVLPVDATLFDLLNTVNTTIHGEELY